MNFSSLFGNSKIIFKVDGKPPQKSEWAGNSANLVIDFRKAALKARNKAGFKKYITSPVHLKMSIYASNLHDRNRVEEFQGDKKGYIGDLDSLIAGACDYLCRSTEEPGRNNFVPSVLFNEEPDIGPTIPLILKDDSQIKSIQTEKIFSEDPFYVVEIKLLENS